MRGAEALVIDASAAVPLVIAERHSAWARTLLLDRPEPLVTTLFWTECANAFWRMQRAPRPGAARIDAEEAFALLGAIPVRSVPTGAEMAGLALRLATRLDHPVYDCLYLALALDRGAALATADARFAAAVRHAGLLPPGRLLTPPAAG